MDSRNRALVEAVNSIEGTDQVGGHIVVMYGGLHAKGISDLLLSEGWSEVPGSSVDYPLLTVSCRSSDDDETETLSSAVAKPPASSSSTPAVSPPADALSNFLPRLSTVLAVGPTSVIALVLYLLVGGLDYIEAFRSVAQEGGAPQEGLLYLVRHYVMYVGWLKFIDFF